MHVLPTAQDSTSSNSRWAGGLARGLAGRCVVKKACCLMFRLLNMFKTASFIVG